MRIQFRCKNLAVSPSLYNAQIGMVFKSFLFHQGYTSGMHRWRIRICKKNYKTHVT